MLTAANNYRAQLGGAWRCSELFSAASSSLGRTHSADEETGPPSEEEAARSGRGHSDSRSQRSGQEEVADPVLQPGSSSWTRGSNEKSGGFLEELALASSLPRDQEERGTKGGVSWTLKAIRLDTFICSLNRLRCPLAPAGAKEDEECGSGEGSGQVSTHPCPPQLVPPSEVGRPKDPVSQGHQAGFATAAAQGCCTLCILWPAPFQRAENGLPLNTPWALRLPKLQPHAWLLPDLATCWYLTLDLTSPGLS